MRLKFYGSNDKWYQNPTLHQRTQKVIETWVSQDCTIIDISFFCIITQLERLQAENAMEWGKRERLETEKLALERDNKKLRADIDDLEESLAKKSKQVSAGQDSNVQAMQEEMMVKNKVSRSEEPATIL